MIRNICIHGHFYQPPRENAWLEEIEQQDSAYPYHDWNERISVECYRPNSASRILDPERRVIGIVSNYSRMSFNFGPTLLSWMENHDPETYAALLEADRQSLERFSGHGSALAQVYSHSIMPLNNLRDKVTQVRWGLADFERRFGRKAEGMWLAETAVDLETLEVLAGHGLRFTILAPGQARRVRPIGQEEWTEVDGGRVNPRRPYLCRLPSGEAIVLFFYDGPLSHDVSFGDLLNDGGRFADRLLGAFPENEEDSPLVHIATDGETYGHHHKYGEMALAYCLYRIEQEGLAAITVYGEYLEHHPPTHEVEIHENTSWSCVHGVERWRSDCGCRTRLDWSQQWRAPLREALDWLRDSLVPLYEREMARFGAAAWPARDRYIEVILDRDPGNVNRFIAATIGRPLAGDERADFLSLLEMQRQALLMYTSCGWFFDEISGIEAAQIMQYAARAIQLARQVSGVELEPAFIRLLSKAPSNIPRLGNGARVYERYVKPAEVDLDRVGAHYAISSLFEEYPERAEVYSFTARSESYNRLEAGRLRMALGRAVVSSRVLGSQERFSFVVLHMGDHNIHGGIRPLAADGETGNEEMEREVRGAFLKSDIAGTIRAIDRHFAGHTYSLWHLFRDEQRKVLKQILAPTLEEIDAAFLKIYADNYPLMLAMQEMDVPLPRELSMPGELIGNAKLIRLLREPEPRTEEIRAVLEEFDRFGLTLDAPAVAYVAGNQIKFLLERIAENPRDIELIEKTAGLVELLRALPVGLDVGKAQNIYFLLCRDASGEPGPDGRRAEAFRRLGDFLAVRCGP